MTTHANDISAEARRCSSVRSPSVVSCTANG